MDHSQAITDYVSQFLSELGNLTDTTIEVKKDSETPAYHILLQTQNPALLIGYHGETLSALQFFLSVHLNQKLNEKILISLNVNDYKERRQTSLEALADSAVAQVRATNQAHALPPMSAAERRLVHMHLANIDDIVTASTGEGRSRSVVISPKS